MSFRLQRRICRLLRDFAPSGVSFGTIHWIVPIRFADRSLPLTDLPGVPFGTIHWIVPIRFADRGLPLRGPRSRSHELATHLRRFAAKLMNDPG